MVIQSKFAYTFESACPMVVYNEISQIRYIWTKLLNQNWHVYTFGSAFAMAVHHEICLIRHISKNCGEYLPEAICKGPCHDHNIDTHLTHHQIIPYITTTFKAGSKKQTFETLYTKYSFPIHSLLKWQLICQLMLLNTEKKGKRLPKKSHNKFSTQSIECHTTAIHSMKN